MTQEPRRHLKFQPFSASAVYALCSLLLAGCYLWTVNVRMRPLVVVDQTALLLYQPPPTLARPGYKAALAAGRPSACQQVHLDWLPEVGQHPSLRPSACWMVTSARCAGQPILAGRAVRAYLVASPASQALCSTGRVAALTTRLLLCCSSLPAIALPPTLLIRTLS